MSKDSRRRIKEGRKETKRREERSVQGIKTWNEVEGHNEGGSWKIKNRMRISRRWKGYVQGIR